MSKKNYAGSIACGGAVLLLDEAGNVVETSIDPIASLIRKLFAKESRTKASRPAPVRNAA